MSEPSAIVAGCRNRQRRVLDLMQQERLDMVIVTRHEHVQWLAGPRFHWTFEPVAALAADGHLTLVAPTVTYKEAAADKVVSYESNRYSTLRNDQRELSSAALRAALAGRPAPKRVGVEFSSFGPHLASWCQAELVDIEPAIYRFRRRKDPDELARLRIAIEATGLMYARGREIIQPGINEIEVFNQLQGVAVQHFGEMMTATGNDYQSGTRGGPAARSAGRGRRAIYS